MADTKQELAEVKAQQEQAKQLWTKLQGIIEYLEGKAAAEEKNVANEDKKVVKKK